LKTVPLKLEKSLEQGNLCPKYELYLVRKQGKSEFLTVTYVNSGSV
jgi:hypothetical protein